MTTINRKSQKIFIASFAFLYLTSCASPAVAPTPTSISPEEYKASSKNDISFKELDKNADKYIGIRVTFQGKIVQIVERRGNTDIRMDVKKSEYFWDDTIYVQYSGTTDALEDDIIQIWGEIKGNYTYDTIAGWKITLPLVQAKYIQIIQSAKGIK